MTALIGVFFFQTGRGTDLGAEAQTGADAVALATADDIRRQILEWMYSGKMGMGVPFVLDEGRAGRLGQSYASRNDVTANWIRIATHGYLTFNVEVEAQTRARLQPAGYDNDDPTDDLVDGTAQFGNNERGIQQATARVGPGAGSFLSDSGYFQPGSGPGSGPGAGGVATTSAGGCRMPVSEVQRLAGMAGVTLDDSERSFRRRYSDCDGGQAVQPLAPEMQVSLLILEDAMGAPLQINSVAYRSPAYQAQLCRRVDGPCAAPGRSMHNSRSGGGRTELAADAAASRAGGSVPALAEQ